MPFLIVCSPHFFLRKSYLDFQFHLLLVLVSFLVLGNGKQPQPVSNISYLPDFVFFVFHLLENLFNSLSSSRETAPAGIQYLISIANLLSFELFTF